MPNRRRLPIATTIPLIAAIALISVSLNVRPADAQVAAGTISAISGDVTITRAGRSFAATFSAPVDVGDQIVTGASGRATVTLTDGSQLELTESSTLLISENLLNSNGTRAKTSTTLLSGLVRSLVRVTAGTPPNYEVRTPNAVASARGTTYDTHTDTQERKGYKDCREFTDVFDYDGVVDVSSLDNPSSPTVELHSGQMTTVPCGLFVEPANSITAATATGGVAGAGGAGTGLAPFAYVAGGMAFVAAGTIGGYAGAGGFSSSSTPPSSTPTPLSVSPER
ncbi:MAG TPA: FecR family protein [Candidatus Binataceae bacterium]|nr:FecR family protein [Candidatus Binataceae bacterium]